MTENTTQDVSKDVSKNMNQNPVLQAQKIMSEVDKKFVFLTISGAHLYGFESFNSDLDIRGCHIPDLQESLKYQDKKDTFEVMWERSNYWSEEVDIVSHSLLKYLHLITKQPNGYILEQMFSPLLVVQTPMFEDLKELAKLTFCKELKHHFGGFFKNQTRLLNKEVGKEIKLTLYQARILCSSIYMARYKKVESNLLLANEKVQLFDQEKLQELVDLKRQGEKNNFPNSDLKYYWIDQIEGNIELLDKEFDKSDLPNFDKKTVEKAATLFLEKWIDLKFKSEK